MTLFGGSSLPVFIEPSSPGEHGDGESVNGTLPDKVPNSALFSTLHEARVIVEGWRYCSNYALPASCAGGRPPAPEPHTFAPLSLSA